MENNYNSFDPLGTDNNTDTNNASQNTQSNNASEGMNGSYIKTDINTHNQPYTYSPQSGYYYPPKPEKIKKEKKKVSFASLVACCVVCALLASSLSVFAVSYFANDETIVKNQAGTTTINVDKTATNAVSAIAQKAVPSVVGIMATASVDTYFGFAADATSEGSGVIYSEDGYIITNYHVISQAASESSGGKILVYLSSDPNTAVEAKVIGYNSEYDLAVIKIDKEGLYAIEFADSNDVAVGDMAVAIGNPGGLDYMSSVSSGIISGLNRTIQLEGTSQMKLLQTDAAINPGNSGGALVDCNGKLVGINSSKISSEEYEGMGFAIPSNTVKKVIDNIIANKDKKYAYVGVKISTDYTAEDLKRMGYPAGAVVESVDEGSPAYNIGIRPADIIVNFDGVEINDYEEYNDERLKHSPGETVNITVYRSGRNYDAQITLGESSN